VFVGDELKFIASSVMLGSKDEPLIIGCESFSVRQYIFPILNATVAAAAYCFVGTVPKSTEQTCSYPPSL